MKESWEGQVVDVEATIDDDGMIRAGGLVIGEDAFEFRIVVLDKNKLRSRIRGGNMVRYDMMSLIRKMADRMSAQQQAARRDGAEVAG